MNVDHTHQLILIKNLIRMSDVIMASYYDLDQYIESDGYFYYIDEKDEDKKHLYCRLAKKGCPGEANQISQNLIHIIHDHNHREDFDFPFEIQFEKTLITAAHKYFVPPYEIYDYFAAMNPEGASMLPFCVVENLIFNEQEKIVFPKSDTFEQFCNFLSSDRYSFLNTYYLQKNESHYIHTFNFDNDAFILFTSSITSLIEIENIHISSTNAVLPNIGNVQLLTYVLAEYGNHLFPIALILWNRQSVELVRDVMASIRNTIGNNVPKIFTDFDLKSVIQSTWPKSTVTGTFDSFCRILYHEAYARQLNIANPNHLEFLKKCTSIILLPHTMANTIFQELIPTLSEELRIELHDFIVYFHLTWIGFGSHDNCYLYNNLLGLTNASRFFCQKLIHMFSSNPTTTHFLRKLVELFNDAAMDIKRLRNNESIRMSEFAQTNNLIIERETINSIWEKISRDEIKGLVLVTELTTIINKYYGNAVNKLEILNGSQLIQVNAKNFPAFNENLQRIVLMRKTKKKEENIVNVCQICYQNKINIMCVPCGHVQMCKQCSDEIEANSSRNDSQCPFCNTAAYFSKAFLP